MVCRKTTGLLLGEGKGEFSLLEQGFGMTGTGASRGQMFDAIQGLVGWRKDVWGGEGGKAGDEAKRL